MDLKKCVDQTGSARTKTHEALQNMEAQTQQQSAFIFDRPSSAGSDRLCFISVLIDKLVNCRRFYSLFG